MDIEDAGTTSAAGLIGLSTIGLDEEGDRSISNGSCPMMKVGRSHRSNLLWSASEDGEGGW